MSVEPLIEQIKDVFNIDRLPVRGLDKVSSMVLIVVLLYQLNGILQSSNGKTIASTEVHAWKLSTKDSKYCYYRIMP